jgi:hypothetical protein
VAEPERPAEPKEEEKPAEEAPEKIAELSLVGLQENKVEQTKEVQVGGRLAERKVDVVARIEIESEGEEKESVQIEERKAEQSELSLEGINSGANIAGRHEAEIKAAVQGRQMDIGMTKIDLGPNDYRDKKLFPDIGEYYFTINVMDGKVNMAPSRYGIGQFNRTRYQNASINHQLKVVNGENQLIFVGPFKSFEEVKAYESRIMPMMPEIMKVPSEIYNTFVIMKEIIPSLTDGVTIGKYRQNYIEQ